MTANSAQAFDVLISTVRAAAIRGCERNLGNYELTQLISIVAKLLTTTRDIAKSNSDKEGTISEIGVYQVLSKVTEKNERSADVIKRDKDLKELDLRKMATLERNPIRLHRILRTGNSLCIR